MGEKKSKITFMDVLNNADIFVSGVALILLVAITFIGVVSRRLFNAPFAWQEEMQVFCTLWLVYMASGAVFRTVDHISIEILVDSFPAKLKWLTEVFVYLIVMATLVFTFIRSSMLIVQLYSTSRMTNMLKIPYFLVYLPLPLGCVLMIVSDTIVTVKRLFIEPFKKNKNEGAEDK